MADFDRGQTFLDKKAVNQSGVKGKYFIGLSSANDLDDVIVAFVLNTERRMDKYYLGCNRDAGKFIIAPGTFSFVTDYTSIMLDIPSFYLFEEIFEANMRTLDVANDKLAREIKNCINFDNIPAKFHSAIKDSFK